MPAYPDPITVFVVDDHTLFRRGLMALIGQDAGLQVIGDASDASEALRLAPGDAAVMDTMGWVLASLQRYEESMRYLRDARLRAPNNAEIRWHLAYVLAKMGRRGEAADELKAALAMPGEFSWRGEARALLAELGAK